MNMIIVYHWYHTQILIPICLVHVQKERNCIGTACCFIPFINSCEKNMLKTMHVSNSWIFFEFVCSSEIVYFRVPVLLVLLAYTLLQVSALFFLFLFYFLLVLFFLFLHKNLHNCFGHLDIPRSLFISL